LRGNPGKIVENAVVWNDGMGKVSNGLDDVFGDWSGRELMTPVC
jgi:hypothetical protein